MMIVMAIKNSSLKYIRQGRVTAIEQKNHVNVEYIGYFASPIPLISVLRSLTQITCDVKKILRYILQQI